MAGVSFFPVQLTEEEGKMWEFLHATCATRQDALYVFLRHLHQKGKIAEAPRMEHRVMVGDFQATVCDKETLMLKQ